jgi:hypothetical protein
MPADRFSTTTSSRAGALEVRSTTTDSQAIHRSRTVLIYSIHPVALFVAEVIFILRVSLRPSRATVEDCG